MDYTSTSGAISRNDNDRMEAHAERYYEEIRKRTTDVTAIAKNTGFSVEDIEKIKRHIFMDLHDLGEDVLLRFDPNYDMAVSWQRLIEGNDIKEMDLVLLKHELHELKLMSKGINFRIAHESAQSLHNYAAHIQELNEKEGVF